MYHISVNSLERSNNGKVYIQKDEGVINFHKVPLVIKNNIMFFSTLEDNALKKWDIMTTFTEKNVVKV